MIHLGDTKASNPRTACGRWFEKLRVGYLSNSVEVADCKHCLNTAEAKAQLMELALLKRRTQNI